MLSGLLLSLGVVHSPGAAMAQVRELSTDRPDRTESAYTVPSQHWQLELDLVNFTRTKDSGVTTESLSITPFNLKYGLNNNTDIQLVVSPYVQVEADSPGATTSNSGFGEVTIRLKHNVWGNDGGTTAFAVMPFVTLPTADEEIGGGESVEGGIILPLAVTLTDSLQAGIMAQINALKDSEDHYSPEFVLSATLGAALTERIGAYVEVYGSRFDDAGERTQATFDAGVTYSPTDTLQFDLGANAGLNNHTDDIQVFLGMSRRW